MPLLYFQEAFPESAEVLMARRPIEAFPESAEVLVARRPIEAFILMSPCGWQKFACSEQRFPSYLTVSSC